MRLLNPVIINHSHRLTSNPTNSPKYKKYVCTHFDLKPQLNVEEDIESFTIALESVTVAAAKSSTPKG